MSNGPSSGRAGLDPEILAYGGVVTSYFFALGLQFVLFPSLAAFSLGASGAGVSLVLASLSAPMFLLLLFGGVAAERLPVGPALCALQIALAIPPLVLAWGLWRDQLSYELLIFYGVCVGAAAAFMLPLRDSALNGVLDRAAARGRAIHLANAASLVTAIQIAAQIAGILVAQFTDRVGAAALLAAQAVALLIGAALALRVRAPRPEARPLSLRGAWEDLRQGLSYAFGDRVMGAMLWCSALVGVFVIGASQVLFPLLVREAYGGEAKQLALLYASFWGASFVSAAALGRFGPLDRPGRAVIAANGVGALALASMALDKPLWAFLGVVVMWGLAAGLSLAMSRLIIQSMTAPAYLGRVLAVYSMGYLGGAPIGSLLAGLSIDTLGVRAAALIPAVLLGLSTAALVAFSPLWRVRAGDGPAV